MGRSEVRSVGGSTSESGGDALATKPESSTRPRRTSWSSSHGRTLSTKPPIVLTTASRTARKRSHRPGSSSPLEAPKVVSSAVEVKKVAREERKSGERPKMEQGIPMAAMHASARGDRVVGCGA